MYTYRVSNVYAYRLMYPVQFDLRPKRTRLRPISDPECPLSPLCLTTVRMGKKNLPLG